MTGMATSPQRGAIINQVKGSAERILFDTAGRDNYAEPYIKLKRRCEELGYSFGGVQDQPLEKCKWIIVWDAWCLAPGNPFKRILFKLKCLLRGDSTRDVCKEALRAGLRDRLALVMCEPPSACPANYDRRVHAMFPRILTWDPTLVDGRKYRRIYLPSPTEFPRGDSPAFAKRKLLVIIASYKFSSHERELYSEVRKAVRFFQSRYPGDFDLYGEGWNPSFGQYLYRRMCDWRFQREFFPSYRGAVRNKVEIYPWYRFGLCYENIRDQQGYVSLKIFDCLRCGVVPIYLGAPDIDEYVDRAAFIDRRDFQSTEELAKFMSAMGEAEYKGYVEAGRAYLKGPKFALFVSEHFVDTMTRALDLEGPREDSSPELAGGPATGNEVGLTTREGPLKG